MMTYEAPLCQHCLQSERLDTQECRFKASMGLAVGNTERLDESRMYLYACYGLSTERVAVYLNDSVAL